MDDEEEDEDVIPPVRLHPALVASCVFTLLSDLTEAVSDFFDMSARLTASHFVYDASRREMHERALLEIETLTQGD